MTEKPPGLLPPGKPMFGPYHRLGDSREVINAIAKTGELLGRAPRNVFQSDIPAVKAHPGPLPEGAVGFEFMTEVEPNPGQPGWLSGVVWSGPSPDRGRPGVEVIPYDLAKIRVVVTKVR